jgi:hypothetical protein
MRENVSLPKPDKTSLGKLPDKKIQNSNDLINSTLQFLNDNNMSLVT